ncbi:MAG: tetratricopeptide repeat protein, partial [Phaeodactylibacter sp.]|nr:tetratricopeptide repeat protein [Phaeodactylibacter sp.]
QDYHSYLQQADHLERQHAFEAALAPYHLALVEAPSPAHRIDIHNLLGRLYTRLEQYPSATEHFQAALEGLDQLDEADRQALRPTQAAILNHLGKLSARTAIKAAIQYHRQALELIRSLHAEAPEAYRAHLANTLFALGDTYYRKSDFYQANKCYNELVELFSPLEAEAPDQAQPALAMAYFQLGAVAADQDKMPEARTRYHKALYIYKQLVERYPDHYRPLLASVLNNLAVVNRIQGYLTEAKQKYEETIEAYRRLSERDPAFLPYHAASLNSLANVYADSWTPEDDIFAENRGFLSGLGTLLQDSNPAPETKDLEAAENYYQQALDIYRQLADREPDTYAHYVATVLHNLGVLYDENRAYDQAQTHYEQALFLRRQLVERQPQAFVFDLCSTQMNLVTLFQTMMEQRQDIRLKARSLDLLEDTRSRLALYDQDQLPPAIVNLLGDLDYFSNYFQHITEAELIAQKLKANSRVL